MMTEGLGYRAERDGAVLRLRLERPHRRNAIDLDACTAMTLATRLAEAGAPLTRANAVSPRCPL